MHLSFLEELVKGFEVEYHEDEQSETAIIRNKDFDDVVEVNYYPNSYYTYWAGFATQHIDTSAKKDVIEFVSDVIQGRIAAIEFFYGGQRRFGGSISTKKLENITYDELRERFGHQFYDLSGHTFQVRAWDKRFCFE